MRRFLYMVMILFCCLVTPGNADAQNLLGLLVANASFLDAEEQAAFNFATSRGFTVTKIDPAMILANPAILDNFDGFWAANDAAPTGFNQPTVASALRSRLEGGKRLLVSW